jgi:hypothetical protein
MLQERLKKLLTTNWHFIGVILFFVVHGYAEYPGLIPVKELPVLLGILLMAALLLFVISSWIFKSKRKAGLFTSFVFMVLLFFGVVQDAVARWYPVANVARLEVFVPLCLVAMIVVFIALKRTSRPLNKPLLFINVLLICYVVFDIGSIVYHSVLPADRKANLPAGYSAHFCDSCAKPSVYLIVLDEYMGNQGLQQYFGYNNVGFENTLKEEGFHIVQQPKSNYLLTVFSMASLLNMQYLQHPGATRIENHYAYKNALRGIRYSAVAASFGSMGYRIVNASPFDLEQAAAGYNTGLLADKTGLLTSQTMWHRIGKEMPRFLVGKKWMPGLAQKLEDRMVEANQQMMQLALGDSQNDTSPTFHYLHLTMPHLPFAFDSTGKRTVPYLLQQSVTQLVQDNDYLQYLVYTNKVISSFIHTLKERTTGRAVILLMSDHGYRDAERKQKDLGFYNLNAVYLPDKAYAGWYDGMTNVNQFRVLFNTLFHQRLPMLADSIVH